MSTQLSPTARRQDHVENRSQSATSPTSPYLSSVLRGSMDTESQCDNSASVAKSPILQETRTPLSNSSSSIWFFVDPPSPFLVRAEDNIVQKQTQHISTRCGERIEVEDPSLGRERTSRASNKIAQHKSLEACYPAGLREQTYNPWTICFEQELPRNAYELIAVELMHFVGVFFYAYKKLPNSGQIRFEACRIILASEASSYPSRSSPSWLRDLILSAYDTTYKAARGPMRSSLESKYPILRPRGCRTLFESCPLEAQLQAYLRSQTVGTLPNNLRLQQEVTRQIQQIENQSTSTAQLIADWLVGLVHISTAWLESSRLRAQVY
ncbi:hypothetical protein BKA59DRAFT_553438 [Fusarium tricinctum]|uniref:Uncharacterized protein n=1 Tax=Fusarium tricinctum TaxID=61284 RepID=A0A8K0S2R1_9HYPO|nr:hypothetical protein BKA59DRAFT_553438 [Fusarium tricinctum]